MGQKVRGQQILSDNETALSPSKDYDKSFEMLVGNRWARGYRGSKFCQIVELRFLQVKTMITVLKCWWEIGRPESKYI